MYTMFGAYKNSVEAYMLVFYHCRCKAEDILLEMDRILRPEGSVIIRDHVNVLIKVKKIMGGMRWDSRMVDHEDGPLVSEKVLFAVKKYWVIGDIVTANNKKKKVKN